ncbi:MAG: prepilin-type N-terminal cleavage/methylation domain-containing protein [Parcubacteria group bacterium]|nr:prepilin-type N-terminal cleavage/methylation domain-containing protein [Parcubacteria group bacterium]
MQRNKNLQKGFTLVELLVVIVIIALLATAGLVGLRSAQRAGRDAKRIADIRSLQGPLEIYFNQNGSYPNALSNLTGGSNPIIARIPAPPGGGSYDYDNCGTNNNTYVIGATLEQKSSALDEGAARPSGCSTAISCATSTFNLCFSNE